MHIIKDPLVRQRAFKNAQVLVVDNDQDSTSLYAFLFESCGAKVITAGSIREAIVFLDWLALDILICEIRLLGESVYPLIQLVKYRALSSGRKIPILAISTCAPKSLAQHLTVEVESYLLKPIDPEKLVDTVLSMLLPANIERAKKPKVGMQQEA